MINRYFELVAFAVNGEVAEEVFYLTDTVNMLQVILIVILTIETRTMIITMMNMIIKMIHKNYYFNDDLGVLTHS